ncbi:hypothetical protein [Massilia sp. CFBP9026]|uniref:hypothetical protein n=1 Tax=Massilia sp. CFBP9026 TaxID=3096536 RepID=UPI002A6B503F|nr:hypothetical protein [Massilia sp. CFBP9026]MDY0964062.1 hypothetical protein [Massilia sp. CFBP9026]
MTSLSTSFPSTAGTRNDRLAGVGVTLAVHLALILAWQMAGKLPPMPQEGSDEAMQWISLPLLPTLAPRVEPAAPAPEKEMRPASEAAPERPRRSVPPPAAPVEKAPSAAPAPTEVDGQPAALPGAAEILANARRSVGEIDRALRKENKPLIVLPPDSPQLRMREGMEHARAMAAPRLWEAPKVEELVNNTGDGARRTRVITGRGTYCVTDRAPTTNVEMIEMHGRRRFTNCPTHETPPKQQVWRTARD